LRPQLSTLPMITYVKGPLAHKNPSFVVVEAGGIGYHINVSLFTYTKIEKAESAKLLTHFHVKEDQQTLYGFFDETERTFFRLLIGVNGVGPSTALVVLSSMNPDEFRAAVIGEDVAAIRRVKGIGPKTAQRIILDLKDKMLKESFASPTMLAPQSNTLRAEALSALVNLGFARPAVQRALNRVFAAQSNLDSSEAIIKLALRELSS
jgi:Holliday junction DNA helicase RuvA